MTTFIPVQKQESRDAENDFELLTSAKSNVFVFFGGSTPYYCNSRTNFKRMYVNPDAVLAISHKQ